MSERDGTIDVETARNLTVAYQTITSNLYLPGYKGGTFNDVTVELVKVKNWLKNELSLYGIRPESHIGICHTALIVEELIGTPGDNNAVVTVDEMIEYMEFMKYTIDPVFLQHKNPLEIAYYLLLLTQGRMEAFREHSFILKTFFEPWHKRQPTFPGIFYRRKIPSAVDIQSKGIDFFYPRVGEMTIDNVMSRFDYREMFHIASRSGAKNLGSKNERNLAIDLIVAVRGLGLDPRLYITLQGPQSGFIQELGEDSMSINDDISLIDLDVREACTKEGILINDPFSSRPVPLDVLFEEYTTAQLTPAFSSHPGSHRSVFEGSRVQILTDGTKLVEAHQDDLIFFGTRDGFAKMMPYTIEELYRTFNDLNDFYDPASVVRFPHNAMFWTRFPRRCIKRLLETILPLVRDRSKWAPLLAEKCRKLLQSKIASDKFCQTRREMMLEELKECDSSLIKKAFGGLYYLGAYFLEYFERIEAVDPRAAALMILEEPGKEYVEPTYTGEIRNKCMKIILFAQQRISELGEYATFFERLVMVKNINGSIRYICDDNNYTIGRYLDVVRMMSKYNLRKCIVLAGKWILETAVFYHKLLFGVTYGDIKLDFEPITASRELEIYGEIENFDIDENVRTLIFTKG